MIRFYSKNAEETYSIGKKLGELMQIGDIICLTGDLGAGKTALTKGIGSGIGVSDYITSPTYTIINEYAGRIPLYHFDVYRINDIDEMYELGYEEYFFGDGAVVVEWADLVKDIIPRERLWITILKGSGEDEREILMEPTGERYNKLVKEMELYADTGC